MRSASVVTDEVIYETNHNCYSGRVGGIPEDATRLGKALTKLASPLSDAGITVVRTRTKNSRGISITRH